MFPLLPRFFVISSVLLMFVLNSDTVVFAVHIVVVHSPTSDYKPRGFFSATLNVFTLCLFYRDSKLDLMLFAFSPDSLLFDWHDDFELILYYPGIA